MKTKLLALSFILFTAIGTLSAHVWTVSNNSITAGHFTSVQIAADSAAVGDTIYIMGSPNDYGNVTLNNMVTIIGAGYAVSGTQNNWNSILDNVYFDSIAGTTTLLSGTRIMGLSIGTSINYTGTFLPVNHVDIERCYIGSTITVLGSYWTIRNNNIYGINFQVYPSNYATYTTVQNNFIGYMSNSNQTTVVIDHNNFVTYNSNAFNSITNAVITNNIFYFCNPLSGCTTCNMGYNLSAATSLPTNINGYAGNVGGANNLTCYATTIGFTGTGISTTGTVTQSSVSSYIWTLKSTSPGHAAASDGTDIGAYGGSYPMPNLTGATRIPQMVQMNVSGVAPAGGNLNVNFISKVQH